MSASHVSIPYFADVHRSETPRSLEAAKQSWFDEHAFLAFTFLTIFYGIVTAALSSLKLLWLDELITVHIAKLGSPAAIWHALSQGADPNPPMTHLAVLSSIHLFGLHTYTFRLPAMIGYWVGMFALFLFLKRHVPPAWALLGTLMSMGMGGFEWSYECRSYAIFYGTTMLALYCWSRVAEAHSASTKKGLFLFGMAFALAVGLCTNYFSVLAFLPIMAGELTRSFQKAQRLQGSQGLLIPLESFDWPVWAALAVAMTPLFLFHRLISQAIALYRPYAWNKVSFDGTNIAYLDMVEAMLMPLGILALCSGLLWVLSQPCDQCRTRLLPNWLVSLVRSTAEQRKTTETPPLPVVVSALTLLVYPYLGWALASLHGGMLSPRFVIPVCFGMAIAGAYVAYRTFGQIRAAAPMLLAMFLLWFMVRESYVGFSYNEQATALFRIFDEVRTVDRSGEPIAVTDNLLILPFHYYAPPDIASRVVYPMDLKAIMNRRGEASGEINMWTGRRSYGFSIQPLASFQHSAFSYLLVTSEPDWLLDDLHAHHYPDDPLVIDTHTEPLSYVATPLSHARAEIFRAYGDRFLPEPPSDHSHPYEVVPYPEPFAMLGEVPNPK